MDRRDFFKMFAAIGSVLALAFCVWLWRRFR